MTRRNSWDIYCHAFMLAGLWALAVIVDSPTPRKRLAMVAGVLLGLSGLSKGPVSFYARFCPAVAMAATGGWRGICLRAMDLGLALGLGLVLSVAWPALAWIAMPDDLRVWWPRSRTPGSTGISSRSGFICNFRS